MARRQLLSNEAWSARLAPAVDDREVIRHYTLSEDDFDGIMRKRLDASRLGYALALCLMRHPGRSLEQTTSFPPVLAILSTVAFGVLFGPLGVLLAAPLTLLLLAAIEVLYVQQGLGEVPEGEAEPSAAPH
jgi:uncharacterized protein DUF4158